MVLLFWSTVIKEKNSSVLNIPWIILLPRRGRRRWEKHDHEKQPKKHKTKKHAGGSLTLQSEKYWDWNQMYLSEGGNHFRIKIETNILYF